MDCTFCKITSGQIPTDYVAVSEHAVAFNDISPRQPVHVLVVPKAHFNDVAELSVAAPEVLADVMALAVKVANQTSSGSFRLTFNTGEEAGQTMFHVHAHVTSTTPR